MRSRLLAVAALAIGSVALSGCLVIADGTSTSMSSSSVVNLSRGTSVGPYLRAFSTDGANVHATIITNCSQRADFEVVFREEGSLAIRQHKDAVCQGPQRDLEVFWTYAVLDLAPQSSVRVANALAL